MSTIAKIALMTAGSTTALEVVPDALSGDHKILVAFFSAVLVQSITKLVAWYSRRRVTRKRLRSRGKPIS